MRGLTKAFLIVLLGPLLLCNGFAEDASTSKSEDSQLRRLVVDMQLAQVLRDGLQDSARRTTNPQVRNVLGRIEKTPDEAIVDLLVPVYRDQVSSEDARLLSEFLELPLGRAEVREWRGLKPEKFSYTQEDVEKSKQLADAGAIVVMKKMVTIMRSPEIQRETMRVVVDYLSRQAP